RRTGEAGRHAGDAGAHRDLVLERRRAQNGLEIAGANRDRTAFAFRDAHRGLTQRPTDLALEIPDAGLAGIVLDDRPDRLVGELDLSGLEAVRLNLPSNEIAPRDLELLARRVAGEADDLHAVAKRARDRVEHIGRRD